MQLSRSVSIASDFGSWLRGYIQGACITRAVETGTWDGQGSTVYLAEGLARTNGHLVTIEANPRHHNMAAAFWHGSNVVTCVQGLTLEVMPSLEQIQATVKEAVLNGRKVDGHPDRAPSFYFDEQNQPGPTGLLRAHMCKQVGLVFLDSAGHLGYAEFLSILDLVQPGVVVAFDDTNHVKHWKSVQHARKLGWSCLYESAERNGSAAFMVI